MKTNFENKKLTQSVKTNRRNEMTGENFSYLTPTNYIDGAGIKLRFKCKKCRKDVEVEMEIKPPSLSADNSEESGVTTEEMVICNCGEEYRVSITSYFGGVWLQIDELPKGYDVDWEIEELEGDI